jgi:GNAT superfamily N-acetyltransferase
MCFGDAMDINLRTGIPSDAADCGRICYEAFSAIAPRHGYTSLFPTLEHGTGLMSALISSANFYAVVAEVDGSVVGSGVLQEWDKVVAGILVISVDPKVQGHGVGERLMRAMTARAAEAGCVAVRLVQAAYNRHSFSLYAKLGFVVREMLVRFNEQPQPFVIPGYAVRPAHLGDAPECDALCARVHGFDRGRELRFFIGEGTARVVEHDGRITGYMTGLGGGWHAVGESNEDLKALIASGSELGGNGFLVPARNSALLYWLLSLGLRVEDLLTLMSTGLYNEPKGAWLPSLIY